MNHELIKSPVGMPLAARIPSEEVARLIGFARHDIPILTRAGLLKPLGHPPPNGVKYYSRRLVLELGDNDTWLGKATDAVVRYWARKNGRRRKMPEPGETQGTSA
jgi:hypothetical protein